MYSILDNIKKPEDVKTLSFREMEKLAQEIREFLIDSVSKTGGHLASNLGVVELTLALFKTLNMPEDAVIWDVGHQSYVHKLLTGRREGFKTMRTFGGMSGFPKSSESQYDVFNTGHSSTSVSAALGMCKAADLLGKTSRTVAVIGDGSLTGGMAFEALNNAGTYSKNFIVVLNDNEMSIAKNVGGLSRYLTKLRTRPSYSKFKSRLEDAFSKIPVVGLPVVRGLKAIKDGVRHMISPSTVFEDLGFTYLGPIDGHDLPFLCQVLDRAKTIDGPVLVHIKTKKGKGYKFAEDMPTAYHGLGSFQVDTAVTQGSKPSYSAVFGETMVSLAKETDALCAVVAAMTDGTGLAEFSKAYPGRFFDVGIAEQHAVTFAAGLSKKGLKPVVAIYSSFLQRAYDQILHDVCLQNLDVVFCIDRAGLVGEDGETHQGLYDMAFLSNMPNMTVLAPANFEEFRQMLRYSTLEHSGPIAIRYPRGGQSTDYSGSAFTVGHGDIVTQGKDVCIVSAGHMLKTALETEEILKEKGIFATVINLRTVSPLCRDEILALTKNHHLFMTLEDGVTKGGIGQQIALILKETGTKTLVKGHEKGMVTHGACQTLYQACGLDATSLAQDILQELK